MRGQTATTIEADTSYLWKMKRRLAVAVAAEDKEKIDEHREALQMLISITDSRHVRAAAWRALAAAQAPSICNPSDTVLPFTAAVRCE